MAITEEIRVVNAFRHGVDGSQLQQATSNPSIQRVLLRQASSNKRMSTCSSINEEPLKNVKTVSPPSPPLTTANNNTTIDPVTCAPVASSSGPRGPTTIPVSSVSPPHTTPPSTVLPPVLVPTAPPDPTPVAVPAAAVIIPPPASASAVVSDVEAKSASHTETAV